MNVHTRKIIISVATLSLLIIALTGLFDDIGKRYTDESFSRALATFGLARGLNAVISVAQGTEIAIEPAGIGAVSYTHLTLPTRSCQCRARWSACG